MLKSLFIVLVFFIFCNSEIRYVLHSKIPKGISFKDGANLYIDDVNIGRVFVDSLSANKFWVSLHFNTNWSVPNNSTLIFNENDFRESYFEIRKGDSKEKFRKGDCIEFISFKGNLITDTFAINKIDLRKITAPKAIIDSLK